MAPRASDPVTLIQMEKRGLVHMTFEAVASMPCDTHAFVAATSVPEEPTIEVKGIEFTKAQVESEDFLDDHGDSIAEKLAEDIYFSQFEAQNRVRALSENAPAAQAMFEAFRDNRNPIHAGIEALAGTVGSDDWYLYSEECLPAARKFLQELAEIADDEAWQHSAHIDDIETELADLIRQRVEEEDDSTPLDVLGSCDRVEIAFMFQSPDCHWEDFMVASHKSWSEWNELSISQGLLHALPRLGYTLEEYRAHSGNEHEVYDEYPEAAKQQPIATLDELEEIVDNACSGYFNFAIYAIVPLSQLLQIDLARPIRLSSYSVCSINAGSGTFHSVEKKRPIILKPQDGRFIAFEKGPADWCGMVESYFHAELSQ